MPVDCDISALSHSELVALVHQLHHHVAQLEQEIAQLKGQLQGDVATSVPQDLRSTLEQPLNDDPPPGSQEDLLVQLDKMYPDE